MRAIRPEIYGYDSQHFAAMRRGEASSALLRAFVPELKRQARAAKVETAPQPQQKVPA